MKKQSIGLLLLILLYLINGICSINTLSITADEGSHLAFGIKMLKGDPGRTNPEKDNSKMPVSVLNATPRAVEQLFNSKLSKYDYGVSDTIKGRYITLFFSVLIILLVFTWSRKMYGVNGGLFSAFLYACCPNSMANAVLVTTETYSVFFLLATIFFLWRYCNNKKNRNFIWLVIILAVSQLVKQSLFHLYVLVPLILLICTLAMKQKLQWGSLIKKVFIAIVISLVIINAGFIFWHVNVRLGDYHFMSTLFQKVQQLLPANLPVPLSESFVTGLDQAKFYDELGGGFRQSSFANVTILGNSSTGGSFWYYYFVTLFFKTPISFLLLFGWSFYLLQKKRTGQQFLKYEFFLLAPVIYYLIVFSFFYKTQCGIRHIIFIYPFLFILSGSVIKYAARKRDQIVTLTLSILLIISVGQYFNNYCPYTNEFIVHKKDAYQYVGAANLNFTQAEYLIDDYLQKHPDVKRAPEIPRPGKFILVVDGYLDIWNTGKYKWLRKLKPVGEVHYSYLLFDVGQKDLEP